MRIAWSVFGAVALIAAGNSTAFANVFHEVGDSSARAWRGRAGSQEILVHPEGFVLRNRDRVRRFRWDAGMALVRTRAEQLAESDLFQLSPAAPGVPPGQSARKIISSSRDGAVAVHYYFGSRGLEFDVVLQRHKQRQRLRLESLDGYLSLRPDGGLTVDGEPLCLKPVARAERPDGTSRPLAAQFLLTGRKAVDLAVGELFSGEAAVIDPVFTYAAYLGGSDEDSAVGLKQLDDGSLLIVGNSRALDIPGALNLNDINLPPEKFLSQACFVTRISPLDKRTFFTSYLQSGYTVCTSFDMDAQGRILLAGHAGRSSTFTTPSAAIRATASSNEAFLARVSANGRVLEYCSYLGFMGFQIFVRSAGGDLVSIAGSNYEREPDVPGVNSNPNQYVLLLSHNIATRRFEKKAHVLPRDGTHVNGFERSPRGTWVLFGRVFSRDIVTANPIQQDTRTEPGYIGFVTEYATDLNAVLFSSYVGGRVDTISFDSSAGIWLAGSAKPGMIPGFGALSPGSTEYAYALLVPAGGKSIERGYFGVGFGERPQPFKSLLLPDGRLCLSFIGNDALTTPGSPPFAAYSSAPLLGCLTKAADGLQSMDRLSVANGASRPVFVVASANGGIWSLAENFGGPDVIPYPLKPSSLRPFPIGGASDLVLTCLDPAMAPPRLLQPALINLPRYRGPFVNSVPLAGEGFTAGMMLEAGGKRFPLEILSATMARLTYTPPGQPFIPNRVIFDLPAGDYLGRLILPSRPVELASEPFPVAVRNLPPGTNPLIPNPDSRLFSLEHPFYEDTEILWNGVPVPTAFDPATEQTSVRLPPEISPVGIGEFTVTNRGPGGGTQKQRVQVTPTTSITLSSFPEYVTISASFYEVDRRLRRLYAITSSTPAAWIVTAHSLPGGERTGSVTVPRNGSAAVTRFRMSDGGTYLYVFDNLLQVTRVRTESMSVDQSFRISPDAYQSNPSFPDNRHDLIPMDGAEGSFVIVSPAGQLQVFDGTNPRPYGSREFPSSFLRRHDVLLATPSAIYTVNGQSSGDVPCLVRYPLDALGLAPPDEICDVGAAWGRYPEMVTIGGNLVLRSDNRAVGIYPLPDSLGSWRVLRTFEVDQNLSVRVVASTYNPATRVIGFRVEFQRLDASAPFGHFPKESRLTSPASRVNVLDDGTLIYAEQTLGFLSVRITADVFSKSQLYP